MCSHFSYFALFKDQKQISFFQCVTGWAVHNVRWRGVALKTLIDMAGVKPGATHLTFYSGDGRYTDSLSLEQALAADTLLAYELGGQPLLRAQGSPLRLTVPPMYGYKGVKWLERIEFTDRAVAGYWQQRGYDIDAWIGRSNAGWI